LLREEKGNKETPSSSRKLTILKENN